MFGMFAMATNLLIGTAGLYSFGQAAFFGAGGYAAGYILAHEATSLPLALIIACGSGGLVAAAVGVLSIRRLGVYFMMLTFAFNQLVFYIIYSWRSVTGGEDGLVGIRRPILDLPFVGSFVFDDNKGFYGFVAVLFLAALIVLMRMVSSPFGIVLAASRQNGGRSDLARISGRHAPACCFRDRGCHLGRGRRVVWEFVPDHAGQFHTLGGIGLRRVHGHHRRTRRACLAR